MTMVDFQKQSTQDAVDKQYHIYEWSKSPLDHTVEDLAIGFVCRTL